MQPFPVCHWSGSSATTLVKDTFTDTPTTPLTSHTPDVGPTPTGSSNPKIITGSKAQSATSAGYAATVYDAGNATITFTIDITAQYDVAIGAQSVADIVVRWTDDNNYWLIETANDSIVLYQRTSGSFTSRASAAETTTNGVTQLIKVVCSGNTITVSYNGVQAFSYGSASQGNTNTKHGITNNITGAPTTLPTWDSLLITTP